MFLSIEVEGVRVYFLEIVARILRISSLKRRNFSVTYGVTYMVHLQN